MPLDQTHDWPHAPHLIPNSLPVGISVTAARKLPPQPTNADLAMAIEEMHKCFEDHREEQALSFKEHKDETTKALTNIRDSIDTLYSLKSKIESKVNLISSNQTLINNAFKLPTLHESTTTGTTFEVKPSKGSKPLALMTQGEALWKGGMAFGGSVGAIFAIWRFIGFAWHPALEFLLQLNHWVIHGTP